MTQEYPETVNLAIDALRAAKLRVQITNRRQIDLAQSYEDARVEAHRAKDDYYTALAELEMALSGDADPAQLKMELKNDHEGAFDPAGGLAAAGRRFDVASAEFEKGER